MHLHKFILLDCQVNEAQDSIVYYDILLLKLSNFL